MLPVLLAAMLLAAAPDEDAQAKIVFAAAQQMQAGHAADAIVTIDPALDAYDRQYAGENRSIVCAFGPNDMLVSLLGAAEQKRSAIAIKSGWCDALFIKGFSLIDLNRIDEGVTYLERAVAMAPNHAHYLNELGFGYQQQKYWDKSYATYRRAADATAFSDKDRVVPEKTRALRGMGYALVEQGRWDATEAAYRASLELDPNDQRSPGELRYIAEHRPKPSA